MRGRWITAAAFCVVLSADGRAQAIPVVTERNSTAQRPKEHSATPLHPNIPRICPRDWTAPKPPDFEIGMTVVAAEFQTKLYESPDRYADIRATLARGDRATVKEMTQRGEADFDIPDGEPEGPKRYWYKVATENGQEGWVDQYQILHPDDEALLLEMLDQPDDAVRDLAINQLGLLRSATAEAKILRILHSHTHLRRSCIVALATYRDRKLIPIFVSGLADDNEPVKITSIMALGNFLDSMLARQLIQYLDSRAWTVRLAAFDALRLFDAPEIQAALASRVDDLTGVLSDLHKAFRTRDVSLLTRRFSPRNGFYLSLDEATEGPQTTDHLSVKRATAFFRGDATASTWNVGCFSVENIPDFEVRIVYGFGQTTKIDEGHYVEFRWPMGHAYTRSGFADLDFGMSCTSPDDITSRILRANPVCEKRIEIAIEWKPFRTQQNCQYGGGVLLLTQESGEWHFTGLLSSPGALWSGVCVPAKRWTLNRIPW